VFVAGLLIIRRYVFPVEGRGGIDVIKALAVLIGVAVTVPVAGAVASTDQHVSNGMAHRFLPWSIIAERDHRPVEHQSTTPSPHPHGRATTMAFASSPSMSPPSIHRTPTGSLGPGSHGGPAAPGVLAAAPLADLRLTITAPSRVRPGGTFSYTIRVANHGPGTPSEVTVRNTLPKGVTRTGAKLPKGVGGYAGAREAALVFPRLAPGRSMVVSLKMKVGRATRGTLTAHGRITYTAGVRLANPRTATAHATTRVR
jgi:uncharacterized repeat protein (TIGR01451 family)